MSRIDDLLAESCPDGVGFLRVGDIASVGTGSSDRKDAVIDGAFPFYVRSKEVLRIDTYEFNEEAILIPGEGGIGEIFHYVSGKYALHQRAYRISFKCNLIDTKFAYYYFLVNFKNFIMSKAVSATVVSIRKPMITGFRIPVPPLKIQREIVNVLDMFTKLEAELEAELEARRQQYAYYRDALLTFSGRSGGASTRWVTLNEVATFKYGYTTKAEDIGELRFIRITDITEGGKLSPFDAKYIDSNGVDSDYLVRRGDVLMARTGATFGKSVLIADDMPAVYASFLIRIRLNEDTILPGYYWHFAQSSFYWKQANSLVSMGGQPQFNANVLKDIRIPIPPLEEQERIVSTLDKFDALVNDLSIGLPAELNARRKQYEYYRDRLLTFKELPA